MKKLKIISLISGGGTNLQAIIDKCEKNEINAEIILVGSDNPNAKGLQRAKNHNIETFIIDYKDIIKNYRKEEIPNDFNFDEIAKKQSLFNKDYPKDKLLNFLEIRTIAEKKILDIILKKDFDLIVLAGFMRVLTPYFIDKINKDKLRIMNIHPAILPAFPGTNGYEDTFNYGCKIGGITVHFIDYGKDTGPIIAQKSFEITKEDTIESVKKKGLEIEWDIYPKCIQLFAENKL